MNRGRYEKNKRAKSMLSCILLIIPKEFEAHILFHQFYQPIQNLLHKSWAADERPALRYEYPKVVSAMVAIEGIGEQRNIRSVNAKSS